MFGYRDLRNGKFVARSNYSFKIDAFCDGKRYRNIFLTPISKSYITFRFSHPSWQVTVEDRKRRSKVLLPDNLDGLKEINTYISGVLKRPVYANIPDKQFKPTSRSSLLSTSRAKTSIKSSSATLVFSLQLGKSIPISFIILGYQEDDIDISNPSSFLCVLGNTVLNQDGVPVLDHQYVFSPEVVQKKVK